MTTLNDIAQNAQLTVLNHFGLVKQAGAIGKFLAGKNIGQASRRLVGTAGATTGAAAGGLIGTGVGAINAEPGSRLEGALKGGLTGVGIGGLAGGAAGTGLGHFGHKGNISALKDPTLRQTAIENLKKVHTFRQKMLG